MYLIKLNNPLIKEGAEEHLLKCATLDELGKTQFIQDTKPTNFPYWKVEGGKVVEMLAEEIAYKNAVVNYNSIKSSKFRGKRYRLEAPPEAVAEPTALLAKVIRLLASKETDQDVDPDTGNVRSYFNTVNAEDVSLLQDDRITIFDSERYNPNSEQYNPELN